jgi:hypothetical protein
MRSRSRSRSGRRNMSGSSTSYDYDYDYDDDNNDGAKRSWEWPYDAWGRGDWADWEWWNYYGEWYTGEWWNYYGETTGETSTKAPPSPRLCGPSSSSSSSTTIIFPSARVSGTENASGPVSVAPVPSSSITLAKIELVGQMLAKVDISKSADDADDGTTATQRLSDSATPDEYEEEKDDHGNSADDEDHIAPDEDEDSGPHEDEDEDEDKEMGGGFDEDEEDRKDQGMFVPGYKHKFCARRK